MVQRACIYVKNHSELQQLLKQDKYISEVVARFKPCFLFSTENDLADISYDSSVKIHNSWPSSLTFKFDTLQNIYVQDECYIDMEPELTWIMNIDCWFFLPEILVKQILYLSPHVYCFDNAAIVKSL